MTYDVHPAAAGLDPIAEIRAQSADLAAAAHANLQAPVEHCPGWTVADLVAHVHQVHWCWRTIVADRRSERLSQDERPARPAEADLLAEFEAGAELLADTLAAADPATPVWTWAPAQQDVAFVIRHQVQEAAVHRWDAEHAAGRDLTLDAALAVDAIEEFLTFSVSSDADPADPPRPALDGRLHLIATDVPAAWTVTDAATPGTIAFTRDVIPDAHAAEVHASASDLLLWLYGRKDRPATGPDGLDCAGLLDRFRALCFTD